MSRQSLFNQTLFLVVALIIASGGFSAVYHGSLYQTVRETGTFGATVVEVPKRIQNGNEVRNSGLSMTFSQGNLENTGNDFDVAIQGEGFFLVADEKGNQWYTRDGSFRPRSTGQLVTAEGYVLQPPVWIPADTIAYTVGNDGTVSVVTAGAPHTQTAIANLVLTRFPNPSALKSEGQNLYTQTAEAGAALQGSPGTYGVGSLQQGFLECLNIQLVSESFIDNRARRVGDTLKILINENLGASNSESDSSRELTDSIQVTVVDILPNGNLLVEGIRRRSVSNETRWMRVSGVVRPTDVTISNSISSQNMSEFNIAYEGG